MDDGISSSDTSYSVWWAVVPKRTIINWLSIRNAGRCIFLWFASLRYSEISKVGFNLCHRHAPLNPFFLGRSKWFRTGSVPRNIPVTQGKREYKKPIPILTSYIAPNPTPFLNPMFVQSLEKRPAGDDANPVFRHQFPDPELKLPKRASLVIIVFTNMLLQVSKSGSQMDIHHVLIVASQAIFFYYHIIFKPVCRALGRKFHILRRRCWHSDSLCWSNVDSYEEIG